MGERAGAQTHLVEVEVRERDLKTVKAFAERQQAHAAMWSAFAAAEPSAAVPNQARPPALGLVPAWSLVHYLGELNSTLL